MEFQGNQHGSKCVYEELPVTEIQAGSKEISRGLALSKGMVPPKQNHQSAIWKKS